MAVPSGVESGAWIAIAGPAISAKFWHAFLVTGVPPPVAVSAAQFWIESPTATGPPELSGFSTRPASCGRADACMPAAARPYSHRTRVMYSPAPRPGGGAVRVVLVAVFGELPHSVKTP